MQDHYACKEMDISHLITYVEKMDKDKLREHGRESKRAWVEIGGFTHQLVSGHERFKDGQKQMSQG